jgi:hypothetical protein
MSFAVERRAANAAHGPSPQGGAALMNCLDATFTLTPRSPFYYMSAHNQAVLFCYGADFTYVCPADLSSLYASNRFYFDAAFAGDPNLDYTQWANRKKARFLMPVIDLGDYGAAQKQLALIFGFDVPYSSVDGRVLVYSDAGLLQDQKLVYGDNQFLIEIESLDLPLALYFIHVGGYWFFRGISDYVV